MATFNLPKHFQTCLLLSEIACSCQNRYAYCYISINLLDTLIVIASRFRQCRHPLPVKGDQPERVSLPLQGCVSVAITNKNSSQNQKNVATIKGGTVPEYASASADAAILTGSTSSKHSLLLWFWLRPLLFHMLFLLVNVICWSFN